MELQRNLDEMKRLGLGVAAISYDSPETLNAFAMKHGITYPLLSDRSSAVIKRYGILNEQASGNAAGVPHPGTFIVDTKGRVQARFFDEKYQPRQTAASIAAHIGKDVAAGAPQKVSSAHLDLTVTATDAVVSPSTRFSIVLDIRPKRHMHVYAPGQQDYMPVSLSFDPDSAFTAHPIEFPPAEKFFFKPLNETWLVYSRPFRLVQDVTVAFSKEVQQRAQQTDATLTLKGKLKYQACDDTICYLPSEVPITVTVKLRRMNRSS